MIELTNGEKIITEITKKSKRYFGGIKYENR